jgi:hypothetical protein
MALSQPFHLTKADKRRRVKAIDQGKIKDQITDWGLGGIRHPLANALEQRVSGSKKDVSLQKQNVDFILPLLK